MYGDPWNDSILKMTLLNLFLVQNLYDPFLEILPCP